MFFIHISFSILPNLTSVTKWLFFLFLMRRWKDKYQLKQRIVERRNKTCKRQKQALNVLKM
jgi:hypothetical protein